jgi:hypothetical protein
MLLNEIEEVLLLTHAIITIVFHKIFHSSFDGSFTAKRMIYLQIPFEMKQKAIKMQHDFSFIIRVAHVIVRDGFSYSCMFIVVF